MSYHFEEDHLGRKERKNERKTLKDRSKYKKTDSAKTEKTQELKEKSFQDKGLLRGRVLSIQPDSITVESEGVLCACTLKGVLKKEKTRVKNLCVVGDFVLFEPSGGIVHVEKRRTLLTRQGSSHSSHKMQVIASNIDQVLITVSVASPPLKPSLIDRFILATRKGNMEPVLLLTKVDLLEEGSIESHLFQEALTLYRSLHMPVIPLSTETKEGMETLREVMRGKASVFSGESGVGKSSLINALTGLTLNTQEVARKTQRGTHTTVSACLVPLSCGGWCIDTPGIQSFGLWDLKREDLKEYFPEITSYGARCKYPDCTHTHEPACAVLLACEEKKLSSLRYNSYVDLLKELE